MSICIDLDTRETLAAELTGNDGADAPVAKRVLEGKTGNVEPFGGDGAYGGFRFRELPGDTVRQIIPPPKNAVIRPEIEHDPDMAHLEQRDGAVRGINETGRDERKEEPGYHRRSLNEAVMYRYKTISGEKLSARKPMNRETETRVNCKLLNVHRGSGMPVSYKVG